MIKTAIRLFPLAGLLALPAGGAGADSPFVLANSKTHKLQVTADGGTAWCQPLVHLRMLLDPDSPDLKNPAGQIGVMNLLKTPIAAECKTAQEAELTVVEPAGVTGTYRASAAGNWSFAAIPPKPVLPVDAQKPPVVAAAPVSAQTAAVLQPVPPVPVDPAPAPAAPASPPATSAPPVIAPPPDQTAFSLPRDSNYPAVLSAYLKAVPGAVGEDAALRWWAAYRYPQDYQQVRMQEFKLRPLLDKAGADLAAAQAAMPGRAVLLLQAQLGSYDFKAHRYPLVRRLDGVSVSPPVYEEGLPNIFTLALPELTGILGLPMTEDVAQRFQEQRTSRYGEVNRQVTLALTVSLDPQSFVRQFSSVTAKAHLEDAAFFADPKGGQMLHRFTAAELDAMRSELAAAKEAEIAAAAQRQAEEQRNRLLAQRDQAVGQLAGASSAVKFANWVSSGPLDYMMRLDSIRSARAEAVIEGRPVTVRMLLQAKGNGRDKVDSLWPGKLQLTVPSGQPELKADGWYLVEGRLTVADGDDLPPAQLTATSLYACTQDKCADAGDARALVDRKLAAVPQAAPGTP